MKRTIVTILKIVVPLALFAYLLSTVPARDYEDFFSRPKRWDLLSLAGLLALVATVVSFLRWQRLVQAFNIPFTSSEALRLGFLSYFLNFVSVGSIGGDLFKAVIVARHKPQAKPEAVASVLLDRAIGLLGLILLSGTALAVFPPANLSTVFISIRDTSIVLSAASIIALLVAIYSGAWLERWIDWLATWPLVGSPLARMTRAVRLLRSQPIVLLFLILASVGVHSMLSLTVYCISAGLYPRHPSLTEHLFVVPTGMAAGTLPLAPGGLGAQELVLDQLFKQLPDREEGYSAILVATIYRLITLAIAGIGLIYYGTSGGRELQEARAEAERLAKEST